MDNNINNKNDNKLQIKAKTFTVELESEKRQTNERTSKQDSKTRYSHETAHKEHFLVCELNFNQNKYCIILVWSSAVKIQ